jgi:hypothetical protein
MAFLHTKAWSIGVTASLMMFAGIALCSDPVVSLDGTVLDQTKRPIFTAQVRVYDGDKLLTLIAQPTSLQGRYHVDLAGFTGNHVTVQIEAKGFSTARVTVVLSTRAVTVDPIVLKKPPGLSAGSLQLSTSPDHNKRILEAVIENGASVPIDIREIHILGANRAKIDCADYSPGVISTIVQSGEQLSVRISVPEENWKEDKTISGRYESLPCGVSRLHLTFGVTWALAPKKRQKLRIEVPSRVVLESIGPRKTVNINSIQFFVLRIVDGEQQATDFKSF